MKPAPFSYIRATSVAHALECLATHEAKVVAGGQSLLPVMNLRMGGSDLLVDIDGLTSLRRVVVEEHSLLIGALVRHQDLVGSAEVASYARLLQEAASHIGHLAIRNRGTIGGSLAHADPSAELPAACLALDARVVCERADGRRREVPIADLLQGAYTTVLDEDELITWIRIPRRTAAAPSGFYELAPREGDFAEAGACAVLLSEELRVAVFAVEARPRAFITARPDAWSKQVADEWARQLSPLDDEEDGRDLAAVMMERAVSMAMHRAAGAAA